MSSGKVVSIRLSPEDYGRFEALRVKKGVDKKSLFLEALSALERISGDAKSLADFERRVRVEGDRKYWQGRKDTLRLFPGICLACHRDLPIDLRKGTRQRNLVYEALKEYLVHDGSCLDIIRRAAAARGSSPHRFELQLGFELNRVLESPPIDVRGPERPRFDPAYRNYDPT